ncbi:glycosyltransferase [uncultured Jannaschia sp.]|uniref:glycosyltransferase n=1 Tax=uncultured Jannaschia sp. TaxID=293347 RepID=UPI00261FC734|nr:glycosyltransferase [uncultured Jannaschia sp.]
MTPDLAFVDTLAPRPYALGRETLEGLGGTEQMVARLAGALAEGATVEVRQARRDVSIDERGVAFRPFDPALPAETFVVVNSRKVAVKLRRHHPDARILLWLHVFPGRHNRGMGAALRTAGIEVVCVSASHAAWLAAWLPGPRPPIGFVHNAIDDALRPDDTVPDRDRLLFASAPHKGLREVYAAFRDLHTRIPSLTLAVADPGYLPWNAGRPPEGVERLGRLGQDELHRRMRQALCLFYPQTEFAETFGLVIAEANALGCPALLHRGLGANDEVASDPEQLLDATDPDAIAARILAWRARRPDVATRPEFRHAAVVERWRRLLTPPRTGATPTETTGASPAR